MRAYRLAFVLILLGIDAACSGGDGSSSAPPTPAPRNLTYSMNPAVYTKGVAVTNNTPSSSGGAVVSYSVSPALPAGLSLDGTTGVVSGTPSAVTAEATYTVTAMNSGGSTSVGLVITVKDVAPSDLTYSRNPAVYKKDVAITNNTPSSSGGAVVSYSVSPALPAGLSLDGTTGVISGTPSAVTAESTYTVTAMNSGGSTSVGLGITVNDFARYVTDGTVNAVAVGSDGTTYIGGSFKYVGPVTGSGVPIDTATGKIGRAHV